MKKICTLLRKTSTSVFLKDIAQTRTMALLFPDYELVYEHPVQADVLLILDTVGNPLQFSGRDLSWVKDIPEVQVLAPLGKQFVKVLGRDVVEIQK